MRITTILMIFIGVLFVIATYYIIAFSQVEPIQNANYEQYVKIRDTSDCTKANDTYCRKSVSLFGTYASCQSEQCPGAFKKPLLGSQGVLKYV